MARSVITIGQALRAKYGARLDEMLGDDCDIRELDAADQRAARFSLAELDAIQRHFAQAYREMVYAHRRQHS